MYIWCYSSLSIVSVMLKGFRGGAEITHVRQYAGRGKKFFIFSSKMEETRKNSWKILVNLVCLLFFMYFSIFSTGEVQMILCNPSQDFLGDTMYPYTPSQFWRHCYRQFTYLFPFDQMQILRWMNFQTWAQYEAVYMAFVRFQYITQWKWPEFYDFITRNPDCNVESRGGIFPEFFIN